MDQYDVTGMSCAACSARVEKAVGKVKGVTSCSVSLLTNSMGVDGTASPQEIISAVEKAGYGARLKGAKTENTDTDGGSLRDTETPGLRKRLIASLVFLVILMYFSMGHMMWGFPLPSWFDGNHVAMGLVQLLLSAIIMVINGKFFINGFKGFINRSPNMDTLVALGSGASFVWSVYALFMMTDAQLHQNADAVMMYMDEFYFESAAMILTLITVGKLLEARSKGKTTDALKGLVSLAPKTANVIRNGTEHTVPAKEVMKGDIFVVRPGESIPVDAVVTDGESTVNESYHKSDGLHHLQGYPCRRGYHLVADNKNGERCGGNKSARCEDCRQGIGNICSDRYCNCRCHYDSVALTRTEFRLCSGERNIGACNKLSVCARTCHSRCDNGRKRCRRKERHSFQDRRFA